MQSHAKVRAEVERMLRYPVPDDVWSFLEGLSLVEDAALTENVEGLAEHIRKLKITIDSWAVTPSNRRKKEGPARGTERRWALSQLVAAGMSRNERVRTFRSRHLGDALLRWEDVETWLKRHQASDGPMTTDLTVTIPHDQLVYTPGAVGRLDPPLELLHNGFNVKREFIDFALPGDEWVRRMFVTSGGVLDHLRRLGDWLSKNCAWQPVQANIYVLAGVTPVISTVRSSGPLFTSHPDWSNRIHLDIDPGASVDEVIEALQHVRQQMGLHKRRTISAKLARLAAFTMVEHADKSWKDRQRLWNEKYREWRYALELDGNFRRDAADARRRLLGLTRDRES